MKNMIKALSGILTAVLVVAGSVAPSVVTIQAASAMATVSTQKQLNESLKKSRVKSIVIKTSRKASFKIKDGDYDKKNLIVNAPKSTVSNYGHFDEITIRDGSTFNEKGYDNEITISDKNKLKVAVAEQAYDTEVDIKSTGGKITIVNNGGLEEIEVNGRSEVILSGKDTGRLLEVENDASGAKFTVKIPTEFSLEADAVIKLKKGAEGSTIELDEVNVTADVTNNTSKAVKIIDSNHKTSTIAAGKHVKK
jgi:hypothetical protein